MKTKNLNIDLMIPQQINKEIIFNEAMNKLDTLFNHTIKSFEKEHPQNPQENDIHIINSGPMKKSLIAYFVNNVWQEFFPANNMIFYVQSDSAFYLYKDNNWQKVTNVNSEFQKTYLDKFISIKTKYVIPKEQNINYLYLTQNSTIVLSETNYPNIIVILKQNALASFKIQWEGKILWPNSLPFQMTQINNIHQVIKFYRLPEEQYFLAEIDDRIYSY